MPKISLLTTISVFVNIFLTFWLVNQYVSDVYFQNYVNNAVGQYYAFIILTIGVGGGSSLGYLFLKKRHADGSLVSRIQKSKSFKPVAPLSTSPSMAQATKSSLPTGAPPSQASKHTVYAVPPLPKSSSPSSTKTVPTTSWAVASKPTPGSIPSSKQEFPSRPGISNYPPAKELPRPSSPSFTPPKQQMPSSPLRSPVEPPPRASTWAMPTPPSEEKPAENGPIFQKPGMDVTAAKGSGFSDYSTPVKGPESSPVPSKWAPPPENKPSPNQWTDSGVRSIPPLPTKWSPPSTVSAVQDRPSPPPQAIPRPGQLPPRNPMSQTPQGAPRPFGIPSPGRPGEPRPIAAPQPFRPNLPRPPIGPSSQQRPPQTFARPPSPSPVGGPMPQPWTPSSEIAQKKEPTDPTDTQDSLTRPSLEPKNSSEPNPGGGGEMDWDTALDTILKTLRKDRVGDSK